MELSGVPEDPFAGYLVEDSDLEYSDCSDGASSEEEGYSRLRSNYDQQEHSSEDEFEKEMASEVQSAIKLMISPAIKKPSKPAQSVASSCSSSSNPGPSSKQPVQGNASVPSRKEAPESQYYDEIYFDSSNSSEDESGKTEAASVQEGTTAHPRPSGSSGSSSSRRRKFKKLTNDELFYDPHMDDEDEKWVRRQRMAYHNVKVSEQLEAQKKARLAKQQRQGQESEGDATTSGSSEQPHPLHTGGGVTVPKSDAVLNCPACMTTLCLDCQRHDIYSSQYRAMFVLNCRVMRDEVLTYVPKPGKKSRKRQRGAKFRDQSEEVPADSEENQYRPVRCSNCNTEVAVMDTEEVFHFFNVLPSAAS